MPSQVWCLFSSNALLNTHRSRFLSRTPNSRDTWVHALSECVFIIRYYSLGIHAVEISLSQARSKMALWYIYCAIFRESKAITFMLFCFVRVAGPLWPNESTHCCRELSTSDLSKSFHRAPNTLTHRPQPAILDSATSVHLSIPSAKLTSACDYRSKRLLNHWFFLFRSHLPIRATAAERLGQARSRTFQDAPASLSTSTTPF